MTGSVHSGRTVLFTAVLIIQTAAPQFLSITATVPNLMDVGEELISDTARDHLGWLTIEKGTD